MSSREPPIKRRKANYGPDGMKVVGPHTMRRRAKALQIALAEEQRRLYAGHTLTLGENCQVIQPPQEHVEPDAQPYPYESSQGDSPSSDARSDSAAAHAPMQDDDCEPVIVELRPLPLRNCPSPRTDTSDTDVVLDTDNSATATHVGRSSADSLHNECAAVTSDDDDDDDDNPASTESGSSTDTEYDNLSPVPPEFDRTNFTSDKLRQYLHSDAGDSIMFPESNLKSWQVILIVLGLCNRFHLSGTARRAVIDAVKLFAGPQFSEWDVSDYYLSKLFDPPDEASLYHFYCEKCSQVLETPVSKKRFQNHVATCRKCGKDYALTLDSPNCFISIDLKYQLISFIHLKVINADLALNLAKLNPDVPRPDHIRDVYDGSLYKNILADTPRDSRLLTCVFNTDGAPLFNSSKRAFWPTLIILNELSPRLRFKYPLLAGMCVVRKEPSPDLINAYMKPFVRSLQTLSTVGFDAIVGEENVHFVLKPLFCSVDSVARPLLQNRLQFNGYFGCSWCYSKGRHINGCMRFLAEVEDPSPRTHDEYMDDARDAVTKNRQSRRKMKKNCQKQSAVRGVKGFSVLTLLDGFDMIWGFARDYLHGDLLGDVLQLVNMWLHDPKSPVKLTKTQIDVLNERLMRMTPPREIHRLVRPIKTEKCKWKASEWRSWLLFYAIPCLTGILNDYALQHFALYVNGIYTLLKTEISEDDLDSARCDLERYVLIFEMLYGEKYVTFNVHTVQHVVSSVRCCGPLWATSAFPFESTIRELKRYVTGPRNVCEQMTRKSMQRNVLRALFEEADDSPASMDYQRSLFGRTEVASYSRAGEVVFLGSGMPYTGRRHEFRNIPPNELREFGRCVYSGMVIHSAACDKVTLKTENTVFRTNTGKFVQVIHLIRYDDTAFAEVACFTVERVVIHCDAEPDPDRPEIGDVVVRHLFSVVSDDGTKLIRVERLAEKCVVMKVDDLTYFARMPNTIEIQ